MHIVLAVLAVLFVLGGFVGLFLGVVPTIVLWPLAALCIIAGWKSRPASQRRREQRMSNPPAA
jgi:predicted PurR-regulated permease PerM